MCEGCDKLSALSAELDLDGSGKSVTITGDPGHQAVNIHLSAEDFRQLCVAVGLGGLMTAKHRDEVADVLAGIGVSDENPDRWSVLARVMIQTLFVKNFVTKSADVIEELTAQELVSGAEQFLAGLSSQPPDLSGAEDVVDPRLS